MVSHLIVEDNAPNSMDPPDVIYDMIKQLKETDFGQLPSDVRTLMPMLHPLLQNFVEVYIEC